MFPSFAGIGLFDIVEPALGRAGQVMPEIADAVRAFDEYTETKHTLVDLLSAALAFGTARASAFDDIGGELGLGCRRGRGNFTGHSYSICESQD